MVVVSTCGASAVDHAFNNHGVFKEVSHGIAKTHDAFCYYFQS